MSVYDCEPPQLDCDIPPPDDHHEISKRRDVENDFDLEDFELSYSMKVSNEPSLITSNVLHLYSSSPPPDDVCMKSSDFEVDEEFEDSQEVNKPRDDQMEETVVLEYASRPLDEVKVNAMEKSSQKSLENVKDIETKELDVPSSPQKTALINTFILEDLPDDEDVTHQSPEPQKPEVPVDDDDFEDFSDFTQAIPVDRHVDQQIVTEKIDEQPFEADFSAFEANFETFSSAGIETQEQEEVDDDFGDFSDFTQAPPPALMPQDVLPNEFQSCTLTILNDTEVKTILSDMFPINHTEDESIGFENNNNNSSESDTKGIIKDVDSTLALTYEYKESSTNHILVKALGIDVRNILFGAQWSSSNMPRFASDLSFNPLEPSKSTSSYKSSSSVVNSNNSSISSCKPKDKLEGGAENLKEQIQQQPDIVPEFDWNVAGLINPLDAHNNYLLGLEHLNQIPSYSRTTNNTDDVLRQFDSLDSNKYVIKKHNNSKQISTLKLSDRDDPSLAYDMSVFESIPGQQQKASELTSTNPDSSNLSTKQLWQNDRFEIPPTSVRERTIKLPETHIFTPIKSISPVAREVSRESSPIENEKDQRPTGIKEYHDVEYSLEGTGRIGSVDSDFGDFNEFQSAVPDDRILMPMSSQQVLEPVVNSTGRGLEPKTTNRVQLDPIASSQMFEDSKLSHSVSKTSNQVSLEPMASDSVFLDQKVSNPMFLDQITTNQVSQDHKPNNMVLLNQKPTIKDQIPSNPAFLDNKNATQVFLEPQRVSDLPKPTSTPIEDDFADFQAAAPPVTSTMNSYKDSSAITLSPSRLVSTLKPQQTSWMDNTIDRDEISRIEAAFPKCKKPQQLSQQQDDDEWCDFQSVSQPTSQSDSSDWSDFVSVPATKPPSQFLSKPNFQSWNKPFINHTTSFLSSNNNYSHFDESFYTASLQHRNRPMTITNNFNYNNFERQEVTGSTGQSFQMTNGISTILPDLQFALPRTLVNLSRGGNGGGSGTEGSKK